MSGLANVRRFQGESAQAFGESNGGGSGGGTDLRLRSLEVQMAEVKVRTEHIEKNMATKTDISNIKVWVLGGVASAMAAAGIGVAISLAKAVF